MDRGKKTLITLALLTLATQASADALTPEQYLQEVQTRNEDYKGQIQNSEGSARRAGEGELATATLLYANAEYNSDSRLPVLPLFTYDAINMHNYSLGVKKLTSFGLDIKAYYLLMHTKYMNGLLGGVTPVSVDFWDARPTVELSQSLWANGFGRATRANEERARAGATAQSLMARHASRAFLVQAEDTYWRLSLARERLEISHVAVEQAEKIHKWNQERVERNLGDEVDALQARAALEMRELELQAAKNEEASAARLFNRMRNIASDQVPQVLIEPRSEDLLDRKIPASVKPMRDDVLAAEQNQRAAIAGSVSAVEKLRPELTAYANYGLNGRDPALGASLGNPFSASRPTYAVGLKFAMPLDRALVSETAAGYRQEQIAAEMIYRQKLNDQKQEWQDLIHRVRESKTKLKLSRTLVESQRLKLKRERERLKSGRTTTFQVLMFETDYAKAQAAEIMAKGELVRTLNQLKLYGGNL